eukprot:639705-Rhodomonas_salina.2
MKRQGQKQGTGCCNAGIPILITTSTEYAAKHSLHAPRSLPTIRIALPLTEDRLTQPRTAHTKLAGRCEGIAHCITHMP